MYHNSISISPKILDDFVEKITYALRRSNSHHYSASGFVTSGTARPDPDIDLLVVTDSEVHPSEAKKWL
jgi:hypothetical protein